MKKLGAAIERLSSIINRTHAFRRTYVIVGTCLTWVVTNWAMHFAETSKLSGTEMAAVIFAVTSVPGALLKYAFDAYNEARKVEPNGQPDTAVK